ncbi:MAG: hypothetical protein ACK5P7_05010 [Bdellovibrio sp.]|jgi:hypothetical protein
MRKPLPALATDESGENTERSGFGDTQSNEGLLRLVEFIKKEHYKKSRTKSPQFHLRSLKIEKYSAQKDMLTEESESLALKKGLQLKKAA